MKVAELEEENQKHKMKIRDLQAKLESAMMEIRRNQNLAVPKSPKHTSNTTNTDSNSISVQDTTASTRIAEKDTLYVSINKDKQEKLPNSSLLSSFESLSPCSNSPEKFRVKDFQDLLIMNAAGDQASTEQILSQFQNLTKEHQLQGKKILKLRSEQMKACEIIKSLIEARNTATDEITELKGHIKELEHELESVVTKPASDGDTTVVSLKQKVTDLNIRAVNNSEDEVDISKKMTDKFAKVRLQKCNRKK